MHEIGRSENRRGLWTDIAMELDDGEKVSIEEDRHGGLIMKFDHMMAEGLGMMEVKHMGKRIDFLRALTQGKEQAICSYLLESFGTLPTREVMQELIRCIDDCEAHGLTMTAEQSRQVAAWQIEEAMA